MLHSLQKCPTRRWPWQKSLHLSLSKHSLLASLVPLPLSATLSCMYSFTLSLQLAFLSSYDSQFHPHTLSSQTLHYSFFQYDQITSKYFFSPIPLHHTSLHLHMVPCHTFQTSFHCSHIPILSCHMLLSDN